MSYVDMLEPENLARLAEQSRRDDREATKTRPSIGAHAEMYEEGKFVIPIEFNTGDLGCNVSASAKLQLRLNLDMVNFKEVSKIKNKDERIKRIRELIQIDAPICQLVFK